MYIQIYLSGTLLIWTSNKTKSISCMKQIILRLINPDGKSIWGQVWDDFFFVFSSRQILGDIHWHFNSHYLWRYPLATLLSESLGSEDNKTSSNSLNILYDWLFPIYGAKYLVFSPLVPSKREKSILVLLSLYIFWGKLKNWKVNTLPSKIYKTN